MRRSTGEHRVDGPDDLVRRPKQVAAERAVAERGDEAWLGHRRVGGEERVAHPRRDRARHEQHVGVPRRGDHAEPEPLQVVVRARSEGQLVLAAVAGARVDVTDGQAPATVGPRESRRSAESAKVAKERQHQRSAQA